MRAEHSSMQQSTHMPKVIFNCLAHGKLFTHGKHVQILPQALLRAGVCVR